ncbi:hypothetical protein B0T17DRAFT_88058 [Bombardia bombarda]|uniref:Uncharacterized protein n=1 Tax=Bombardia bombarda TaxID=252184 RepID=A0AA39XMD3_9PEZI|nr:hypothetical protein B0T17DRAFT_88058 [Bombardia bombarda]
MNITLNTFLAFFTTFTKAAFMSPISEALSQWKWNIYTPNGQESKGRSLADFQVLDSASRGAWGNWTLIRNFKWRHFVSFAAVFSILSIFTSPITQQMIAYTTKPAPTAGEASVPYTRVLGKSDTAISMAVASADFQAISSTVAKPVEHLAPTCSAGNCTFDQYQSLAVCMKMTNITEHLRITEIKNSTTADWTGGEGWNLALPDGNGTTAWNASLPNGLSFVTPLSLAFAMVPQERAFALTDPNDNFTAVAHFILIYSNAGNVSYQGYDRASDTKPWDFQAVEVLYHACVNTYETTFAAGNSTTSVVSSSNVPLSVDDNKPLYNTVCHAQPDLIVDSCDYVERVGNVTYLQDPSAPGDLTKRYAFNRFTGTLITWNMYFDLMNTYVTDGLTGSIGTFVHQGYLGIEEAIYGKDQAGLGAAQQYANLQVVLGSAATSMSNA